MQQVHYGLKTIRTQLLGLLLHPFLVSGMEHGHDIHQG